MPAPIRNGPMRPVNVTPPGTVATPVAATPATPMPWKPPMGGPAQGGPAQPMPGPLMGTPAYDIEIPDNLGRPPRATDVKVITGFDGLSPAAVVEKTLLNLKGKVAPQNLDFVKRSIVERHRDFTVACSNVFVANAPPRKFLESLNAQSIRVLGTMSSLQPVVFEVVRKAGAKPEYYARNSSGGFEALDKPRGTPVMAADVRLTPAGIAVSYLPWTNKSLAGPLTTITES